MCTNTVKLYGFTHATSQKHGRTEYLVLYAYQTTHDCVTHTRSAYLAVWTGAHSRVRIIPASGPSVPFAAPPTPIAGKSGTPRCRTQKKKRRTARAYIAGCHPDLPPST
eukprot:2208862-Prymnesium_polylepis.2